MDPIIFIICGIAMTLGEIYHVDAGLFDAFGDVIDHSQIEEPMKAFNPMYQINHSKEALDAGFNGNINRSYGRNSWWILPNGEQRPITNGFPQYPSTTERFESKADVHPRVAKQYPEGAKLLNRLKELNKMKEGKLFFRRNETVSKDGNNDSIENKNKKPYANDHKNNSNVDPEIVKRFPEGVKLLNNLKELNKSKTEGKLSLMENNSTSKKIENDREDLESETTSNKNSSGSKTKNKLKPFSKPKFYFQVQPVIPKNEEKEKYETIYYSD